MIWWVESKSIVQHKHASEYIKLHPFEWYILIDECRVRTDPDLNVVRRSFGQLSTKPGRVVELAASTPSTTTLSIPERVIGVKNTMVRSVCASFTEVILANELWNENSASMCTGTNVSAVVRLPDCRRKGPDVLTRGAVGDANSINIIIIYCRVDIGVAERTGYSKLVADKSPTHASVTNAVRGEEC